MTEILENVANKTLQKRFIIIIIIFFIIPLYTNNNKAQYSIFYSEQFCSMCLISSFSFRLVVIFDDELGPIQKKRLKRVQCSQLSRSLEDFPFLFRWLYLIRSLFNSQCIQL